MTAKISVLFSHCQMIIKFTFSEMSHEVNFG
jgi:hypothetical protein